MTMPVPQQVLAGTRSNPVFVNNSTAYAPLSSSGDASAFSNQVHHSQMLEKPACHRSLAESVTAATAAITADPSFTVALAAAITSIISSKQNGQSQVGQTGVRSSAFTSVAPNCGTPKLSVSTPRAPVVGEATALSTFLSSALMSMTQDQSASGVIKPSATPGSSKEVQN